MIGQDDNLTFPAETAVDMETAEFLRKCGAEGLLEELGFIGPMYERLRYVLDSLPHAVTETTDDILLETVAKYVDPGKHPDLYAVMADIAYSQCKNYAESEIRKKQVSAPDWEDYLSILKVVILSNMAGYDAGKGKIVTFLKPYIGGAFFSARNEGTTPYYAKHIRLVMNAKKQLAGEGVSQPDAEMVADHINKNSQGHKITARQVKSALESVCQTKELDENITAEDESNNPELRYFETADKELLHSAGDDEHWAVSALYEVFKEYYFSENPEGLLASYGQELPGEEAGDLDREPEETGIGGNSGPGSKFRQMLPIRYLRKALQEKTGREFSEDAIKSLIYNLQVSLAGKGYGADILRSREGLVFRTADASHLETALPEDDQGFELVEGSDVRMYDLTKEIFLYPGLGKKDRK